MILVRIVNRDSANTGYYIGAAWSNTSLFINM